MTEPWTEADEDIARRQTLEREFPLAVRATLLGIQQIGAAERAIDAVLTDTIPLLTRAFILPTVDREEWYEKATFRPSTPIVDATDGELGEARRRLVYLRGLLSLYSDAAGENLKKLLADADAEGISVPTTLNPVTPQDLQA